MKDSRAFVGFVVLAFAISAADSFPLVALCLLVALAVGVLWSLVD